MPIEDSILRKHFKIDIQQHKTESCNDIEALALTGKQIVDEIRLKRFLGEFAHLIGSSQPEVTGSLFIKRYVPVIVGSLYAFIVHDSVIAISLDRISVVWVQDHLRFRLTQRDEPITLHAESDRNDMRMKHIMHLYHDNIKPVWNAIMNVTGIDEQTLWATLSYLLAYWKEEWIRSAELPEQKKRIEEDYRYITENVWRECFKDIKRNPFICRFLRMDNPMEEGKEILVRAKCCLNYRLPGEDQYCYTCPRLTEARRLQKFKLAHSTVDAVQSK